MDALAPLLPEVDFAYDEVTDLHELLDELRAHGPVVRVKYLGAPVWAILDHKELNQAFNDLEHFDPGDGYRIISAPSMGNTMQTMSGEQHRAPAPRSPRPSCRPASGVLCREADRADRA
jgi:hypothetical protein